MVTILRNSDWERKKSVQKGNIGEDIVRSFLESKGFVVYTPVSDGAHPFDMLCVKQKRMCIAAEVKTKAARTYYPDTGFNISTYEDYIAFSKKHNMDIFIFFVDENCKKIYGNWLRILDKETKITHNGKELLYPMNQNGQRYFPINKMRVISEITDIESSKLKELSSRNYEYGVII